MLDGAPTPTLRDSIRGSHRAQVPVGRRFPSVPAEHTRKAPTERFRWSFAARTPDEIRPLRYRLERAKPAQRIRAGQRGYGLVRSRVWGTHEARLALENVKAHASFRTRSTACDNRRRLASSRSGVEARSRRWRLLRAVAVAGPGGGGVCDGDRGADAGGIVAGQTGRLPGRQLGGKLDQRRRDSGAGGCGGLNDRVGGHGRPSSVQPQRHTTHYDATIGRTAADSAVAAASG